MLKHSFRFIKSMLFNRYLFILLLILAGFIAGAVVDHQSFKPDLKRLYMQSHMVKDQPPVIFIHGVLGSRLRAEGSDEDLWPGAISRLLGHDYSDIALQIDPETNMPVPDHAIPHAIFDGAAGKDFYGKIIETLSSVGGYQLKQVGQPINPADKNYYVFLYDWRQDNVKSAQQLCDFIEQIRKDYNDPDLKVDIVAHSMGGLITRYYLRYGRQDVIDDNDFDQKLNLYGAERVRRVVLLGTPNLGSSKTLNLFITGLDIGINHIGTETLASMPSLFQLFPHAVTNWIVSLDGEMLERDLFDVEIWRRFEWSIFNPEVRKRLRAKFTDETKAQAHLQSFERYFEHQLERARRFVWALSIEVPDKHPDIIAFGGACNLTPARILVEEINGVSMVRISPDDIENPVEGIDYDALLYEPGDGSVTKASLLGRDKLDPSIDRHMFLHLPISHSFFLCESHESLTGNLNFQDNLLNTLLSREM